MHLWFSRKVNYYPDGAYTKDGMWFYLNLFGLDGEKCYDDIKIPRSSLMNHLFMKNVDELLIEGRT